MTSAVAWLDEGVTEVNYQERIPPQSLFIVSDLDDQWDIEDLLKPLSEHEGY